MTNVDRPEGARIRVLIADDHPVFRYGMLALLRADPTIDVVGEAVVAVGGMQLCHRQEMVVDVFRQT